MKKFFLMGVLAALTAFSAAAQEKENNPAPRNANIEQIQLALRLADYGYANYAPVALIQAAEILNGIPVSELEATRTEEGAGTVSTKPEKPVFSVERLLADAKVFAEGDAEVLALADRIQVAGPTRGSVSGPWHKTDAVKANTTDIYTIRFYGGSLAEVFVSGDGDTDLDLYIYDENGNLITKDDDYSDDCLCRWYPRWTGVFKVKIVNRGSVYNRYQIYVN